MRRYVLKFESSVSLLDEAGVNVGSFTINQNVAVDIRGRELNDITRNTVVNLSEPVIDNAQIMLRREAARTNTN